MQKVLIFCFQSFCREESFHAAPCSVGIGGRSTLSFPLVVVKVNDVIFFVRLMKSRLGVALQLLFRDMTVNASV